MKISGIYTITNIVDGKIYVGCSNNLDRRLKEHRTRFLSNSHGNEYLSRAVKIHGIDNFLFETLEECDEKYMFSQEHYWCTILNTINPEFGYNLRYTHPEDKRVYSKETRAKISHNFKTITRTPEWCVNISKAKKGIDTVPKELRKRLAIKRTGTKMSRESSEKKSIKNKIRYSKEFDVHDLEGNYIRSFMNVVDAVKFFKFPHNTKNNISANLRGDYKKTHGYIFKYKIAA